MQVNAVTLQEKIQRWEGLKRLYGELSLNEEYQLGAYKMLLQRLALEELAEQYTYDPD